MTVLMAIHKHTFSLSKHKIVAVIPVLVVKNIDLEINTTALYCG